MSMRKIQAPRARQERPKQQASGNAHVRSVPRNLEFGVWNFSGAWLLELGAFIISLLFFFPFHTSAQTNKSLPGSRYLLILETSRSMDHRANGTLHAIERLLLSGIGGQLRAGDTLGIWTYNSTLFAGRFPLQYWYPQTHNSTVQKALIFLQS